MAFNRIRAAKLLTGKEMDLFEATLPDHAQGMSDRELAGAMKRVRTQRDKYQDLLQRQKLASRARSGTKAGPRGDDNARTQEKASAFAEALSRLEKLHKQRARAASRDRTSDPRPSSWREAKPAGSAVPRARGSGSGPGMHPAEADPSVPHTKRMQAMGQQRPLAHVSARGRRNQARRDSR